MERVFCYWVSDILNVDIIFGCGDLGKIESDRRGCERPWGMWWYMGRRGRGLREMPRTDLKCSLMCLCETR